MFLRDKLLLILRDRAPRSPPRLGGFALADRRGQMRTGRSGAPSSRRTASPAPRPSPRTAHLAAEPPRSPECPRSSSDSARKSTGLNLTLARVVLLLPPPLAFPPRKASRAL